MYVLMNACPTYWTGTRVFRKSFLQAVLYGRPYFTQSTSRSPAKQQMRDQLSILLLTQDNHLSDLHMPVTS